MTARTSPPRPRRKGPGRYHHGALRDALVEATLGIVGREGTGAVSLSAVARRVGVSPQASYNHFRDKEELLAAAAVLAMGGLWLTLREAAAGAPEDGAGVSTGAAGSRLEGVGLAYVRFARGNAAAFRLLCAPELADKARHPELLAAYDRAFEVLLEAVADAQRAGVVRAGDPRDLSVAAWAMVHGLSWLVIDGQLSIGSSGRDPDDVARGVLRTLFSGLRVR